MSSLSSNYLGFTSELVDTKLSQLAGWKAFAGVFGDSTTRPSVPGTSFGNLFSTLHGYLFYLTFLKVRHYAASGFHDYGRTIY
jgi:hypothetical protein